MQIESGGTGGGKSFIHPASTSACARVKKCWEDGRLSAWCICCSVPFSSSFCYDPRARRPMPYFSSMPTRVRRREEALLMVILGIILTTVGIAAQFHLSPLMASMVVGFVIDNMEKRHRDFFLVIE